MVNDSTTTTPTATTKPAAAQTSQRIASRFKSRPPAPVESDTTVRDPKRTGAAN